MSSIYSTQIDYNNSCSAKNGTFGTLRMLLTQEVDVLFGPICSTGRVTNRLILWIKWLHTTVGFKKGWRWMFAIPLPNLIELLERGRNSKQSLYKSPANLKYVDLLRCEIQKFENDTNCAKSTIKSCYVKVSYTCNHLLTLNSLKYLLWTDPCATRYLPADVFIFQQDNALTHRARDTVWFPGQATPQFTLPDQTAMTQSVGGMHYRWRFGAVGSDVGRINEVTLRRGRLVLGWVTPTARNLSQFNQPPRSTQPGHPFVGRRNEYRSKGGDALWLGSKGRYGVVCR